MAERLLLLEAAASGDGTSPITISATICFQLIIRGLSRIFHTTRTQVPAFSGKCRQLYLKAVFVPAEPAKAGGDRGDMKRRMIYWLCFALLGSVFAVGQGRGA